MARNFGNLIDALAKSPKDRKVRVVALDAGYQFHKDLIDFQRNEIIGKHYSLIQEQAILSMPLPTFDIHGVRSLGKALA
jgi:hypothetical protein